MPVKELAKLVKKEQLKQDIFKFTMEAPEIVKNAEQGQFVEVRVTDGTAPFLRRPISIHNIDKEKGILEFIFQVKGEGTIKLSQKKENEKIDLLGPLGNGAFEFKDYNNIAILGGGIGIFPLYELAKNAKAQGLDVNTYLGFRSKNFVVLEKEFASVSNNLILTTDDGTYAKPGFAINFLKEDIEAGEIDCIYACGPLPMLKAVRELAIKKGIPCQISLEERMGCGLGVCLGCAVRTADSTEESPKYIHVCKAGPVFEAKEVIL